MASWLRQQAINNATAPAFYWQDKSWSFLMLYDTVKLYQKYFQQKFSKEKVSRVAIFANNSPEMVFAILALWEMAVEIQFLNTRLSSQELNYQLKDAAPEFVILAAADFVKVAFYEKIELPNQQQVANYSGDAVPIFSRQSYQEQQIASIMYTSGTTGAPKGVPQTFGNHLASSRGTQQNMEIVSTDCWLNPLPLFHISGLSILLRSLVLGHSFRLYEKFNPVKISQDILNGQGTIVSLVTKTLTDLLPTIPDEGYPQSFRYVLLGGGPVSEHVLQQAEKKKLAVIQSFGMTETCSQVVALPPNQAPKKLGSAGLPIGDTQIKILPAGNLVLSTPTVGEILLKGSSIVHEYLNQRSPESWDRAGWFHTGDLGYLDQEKYLYLVSRLSELIISGGENIYPAEVEAVLLAATGVLEAAVVGEPDTRWGHVPIAFLKIDESFDFSKLKALIQKNLAHYKQPTAYFQVTEVPKTGSGKPQKRIFLTEERVNYIEHRLDQ